MHSRQTISGNTRERRGRRGGKGIFRERSSVLVDLGWSLLPSERLLRVRGSGEEDMVALDLTQPSVTNPVTPVPLLRSVRVAGRRN
jgi:hypothetical protein